jgi:hypothetical protein
LAKVKLWLMFSVEIPSNIMSPTAPENTGRCYFLVHSPPWSHSLPVHIVSGIKPIITLHPVGQSKMARFSFSGGIHYLNRCFGRQWAVGGSPPPPRCFVLIWS